MSKTYTDPWGDMIDRQERKREQFENSPLTFLTKPIWAISRLTRNRDYQLLFDTSEQLFQTRLNNPQDTEIDYFNSAVLDITDGEISQDIRTHCDDAMNYFYDRCLQQRLQGDSISDWRREFLEFYRLSLQNQCLGKHLKMFCKIPSMYLTVLQFILLANQTKSVVIPEGDSNFFSHHKTDAVLALRPLGNIEYYTQRDQHKSHIYFETDRGNLVLLKCVRNRMLEKIVKETWQDFRVVSVPFLSVSKSRDLDDFYFYCADSFEFA